MSDTISWYYKDHLPEQERLAFEKQTKENLMKQEEKIEVVELNLKKDLILQLSLKAHEKDITLNQLFNDILSETISNPQFLVERDNIS